MGKFDEAQELIKAASLLREAFHSVDHERLPRPVRLSAGEAQLSLICFPSFSPVAGPHEYARFAAHLRGISDVWALLQPGFATGESLPASVEALAAVHAETVMQCAGTKPFVLLGRSAGGWVAHAVAQRLEALGTPPVAVVLLDTSSPAHMMESPAGADVAKAMVSRESKFDLLSDNRLSAMGAYVRIFDGWNPDRITAPTMLVRATEYILGTGTDGLDDDKWRSRWELSDNSVDVVGNHFTMLEEHSANTARVVWDRLTTGITSLQESYQR